MAEFSFDSVDSPPQCIFQIFESRGLGFESEWIIFFLMKFVDKSRGKKCSSNIGRCHSGSGACDFFLETDQSDREEKSGAPINDLLWLF